MPAKSSKIKVIDINDTMETITETVDNQVETVDNQVETVDIPIVEDEIKLLPKTRAKAKSKLPVEDELINDIEELPKPKAKSKSRAKPKVNDIVYDDIEVEELPKPKAKAKPKAKKEIVKLEEVPEEEQEISPVKTKKEPKQECQDCHKMIAAKSLKYDYHKCITKKIKAFKEKHPEKEIKNEEIKNEEIKTEAVINDDVVVNEFEPSITHKTTTVVIPKPTRAALRKERMKDLFVEAV